MIEEFKEEMKRPSTAIAAAIGLVGILIGVVTSLYFYYKSVREGVLYYQVTQVQAFDQGSINRKDNLSANPLYVVDGEGHKINNNVYAASIKVWNGGNDEIRKVDVRENFRITVDGKPSFFNIAIDESTNSNIDKFAIEATNGITWEHFDPGEGFTLRLIYASELQKGINIHGYAVNNSGPNNADVMRANLEDNTQSIFLYTIMIFGGCFFIYAVFKVLRASKEEKGRLAKSYLLILGNPVIGIFCFTTIMIIELFRLLDKWIHFIPVPPL